MRVAPYLTIIAVLLSLKAGPDRSPAAEPPPSRSDSVSLRPILKRERADRCDLVAAPMAVPLAALPLRDAVAAESKALVPRKPLPKSADENLHRPILKRESTADRCDVVAAPLAALPLRDAVAAESKALVPRKPLPKSADENLHGGLTPIRRKIDDASGLAARGALYAARAALMEALKVLADHLDAAEGSTVHRSALAAALLSLEEAGDFITVGPATRGDLDVMRIAATHRTPVADLLPHNPTPAQARACYYAFAVEHFGRAFAGRPEAAMALHGLGRLHTQLEKDLLPPVVDICGNAIVFQRAALMVDPHNYLAANELGVLLAREGQHQEAAVWLARSARVSQRSEAWHNLAVVSQQLGDVQLAESARRRSAQLGYQQESPRRPSVVWVTPEALSGGSRQDLLGPPTPRPRSPSGLTATDPPKSLSSSTEQHRSWPYSPLRSGVTYSAISARGQASAVSGESAPAPVPAQFARETNEKKSWRFWSLWGSALGRSPANQPVSR